VYRALVVAGYIVVRSLINHPVLLAAGFRWANFDFRSGIRLSCAYYMSILYIVYLSRSVLADRCVVVAAAARSRWRRRRPFVRSANVTTRRSGAVEAAPTHREPTHTHTHTHTVTGNVFITLTKWKKKRVHEWVVENLIWNYYTRFKYFS